MTASESNPGVDSICVFAMSAKTLAFPDQAIVTLEIGLSIFEFAPDLARDLAEQLLSAAEKAHEIRADADKLPASLFPVIGQTRKVA